MIVKYLSEDGALCNFTSKVYDEIGTYRGGAGYRQLFKTLNDKINLYHELLCCLTGEKRANIYESIPVIDFLNYENTSLTHTYIETDNPDVPVDNTYVINQPCEDEIDAQTLIEENNQFTINRAVSGYNTAEHFYNSVGLAGNTTNLQVSSCLGDHNFVYKGLISYSSVIDDSDDLSSLDTDVIRTDILCYKVLNDDGGTLTINATDFVRNLDNLFEDETIGSNIKVKKDKILNAYVLNTVTESDSSYAEYTNPIFQDVISYYSGPNSGSNKEMTLRAKKDDIFVILPRTTYTSEDNRLIFFKSSLPAKINRAWSFTDPSNPVFDSPNAPVRNVDAYYYNVDDNTLYIYNSSSQSYVKATENEINANPTQEIGVYEITNIVGLEPRYSTYELFFENYNSDFNASFIFDNLEVEGVLPDYLLTSQIFERLNKVVSIEKEYYSDASGLLNGLFCEPKERQVVGDSHRVTKWKMVNESDIAARDGSKIDIGSKYNSGHLLYRGNILSSPLKTTNSNETGYNGKASYMYNQLFGDADSTAMTNMFSGYMMDFGEWTVSNNRVSSVSSLITKFDYTNQNVSAQEARNLSGLESPSTKKVKYMDKFVINDKVLDINDIDDYISKYQDRFNFTDRYLDLNDSYENVTGTYSTENRKRHWINDNTTQGYPGDDTKASELIHQPKVAFYYKYSRVYKKNSQEVDSTNVTDIQSISPMDLFTKEGENPSTILVYPDFAINYPECMYLMSRTNLILHKGDGAFFYYNRNFLVFTVERAYNLSPTGLNKIRINNNGEIVETTDSRFMPRACFIYKLKPLKIKVEPDAKLYDWKNRQISIDSLSNKEIIGASYPDSYFKVTSSYVNGLPKYKLESNSVVNDIYCLSRSSILKNLPRFNGLSQLNTLISQTTGVRKSLLETFYRFIDSSSTVKKIANILLRAILSNWPVSDSQTNPLTLKEVAGFVANLERFSTLVDSISDSSFEVDVNGSTVTINKRHFEKLLARLNDTSKYSLSTYSVRIGDPSAVSGTRVNSIMEQWLTNNRIEVSKITSVEEKTRRSYEAIRRVLTDFFGKSDGITLERCRELDEIFGNNTEPFAAIGETYDSGPVSSTMMSSVSEIANKIIDATYNACTLELKNRNNNPNIEFVDPSYIKSLISEYYSREYDIGSEHVRNFDIGVDSNWTTFTLSICPPTIQSGNDITEKKVVLTRSSDNPYTFTQSGIPNIYSSSLVSVEILEGLADFIKTSLEGTNTDGTLNNKFVNCLSDDKISGRPNSLYYRRYNILNSRMNKLTGPLYKAGVLLQNIDMFNKMDKLDTSNLHIYEDAMTLIPIAEMEPMTYLHSQKATETTIELDGKFYSDKEMEALRNQIGSSCVLTCTICRVKDSCPFYDQEEVIKMYCSSLEYIDFWVKDNELELLDKNSFNLDLNENGIGFDMGEFDTKHLPYSDILKYKDTDETVTNYSGNELNKVRNMLRSSSDDSSINLNYDKYVHDDLGWLVGGRYGTVEKNTIKNMDNVNYADFKDQIHDYKYLYNALFINIDGKDSNVDPDVPDMENDSYIDYKISSHEYDIHFEKGPAGNKTIYSGKTRIKIPNQLKMFKHSDPKDDVYLVSDDELDPEGLAIKPVIYLGKVGTLDVSFDLVDDGIPEGVTDEADPRLYAADVAQWCANYYKGCMSEDPIGYSGDVYKDQDQYWMDTVYKKIGNRWCPFSGRRKIESGYVEPVVDQTTSPDDIMIISGHPVVNTYVDFVRRVSIRMYNPEGSTEADRWLIPFVNRNLPLPWPNKSFEDNVEIQRKVLTLMKTNLKLVVVKQYD